MRLGVIKKKRFGVVWQGAGWYKYILGYFTKADNERYTPSAA